MTKNKILALKYRPQEFKDLIGQEVMAQTITNAIKLKNPNAISNWDKRWKTTQQIDSESIKFERNLMRRL